MNSRTVVAIVGVFLLCLSGGTAGAQQEQEQRQVVRSVNPEALDFDLPGYAGSDDTKFRLDVFYSGPEFANDRVIKSTGVMSRNVKGAADRVRVDITGLLKNVPDGRYTATLFAIKRGETIQSERTPVFVLSRSGIRDDETVDSNERFWTKVGLSIAGGLLLVPFLVR